MKKTRFIDAVITAAQEEDVKMPWRRMKRIKFVTRRNVGLPENVAA